MRWQRVTGKEAVLEATGQTWDQVRASRLSGVLQRAQRRRFKVRGNPVANMMPEGKSITAIDATPKVTIKMKIMTVEDRAAFQITSGESSAIVL